MILRGVYKKNKRVVNGKYNKTKLGEVGLSMYRDKLLLAMVQCK